MAGSTVARAAEILLGVRGGGPRAAGLGEAAPRTEAEAWAIQQEVLRRAGEGRIGGWKCAAPPGKPATAAIMDAAGFRRSPARWQVPAGGQIGIETEIAFRLGRDLPPRATGPYSEAEVLEAIAAAFPAIELVSSRYADPSGVSVLESMADAVAHAGFVMGEDVPGWRGQDLAGLTVRQTCGGAVQVERVGGNPSGGPLVALVWLANHLPSVGLQLRAGEVVTTGSCTGLLDVAGGQRVTGGFPGFGEAVVDLA